MRAYLRDTIVIFIMAIVIFLLLQATVQSSPVVGSSMEPSLQREGQRLLINKLAYLFHEPERGDIITFYPPNNPKADPFIKRIIGLPGESVEIREGIVYIHREGEVWPLDESAYVKYPANYTYYAEIPDEHYFVLGDNRPVSNDSHNGWTVPRENIIGKAWLSIWPPSEWGLALNYPLEEQLASSMISICLY